MKLAMEIPTAHLAQLSELTDVDFALAHLVLENKVYAEFYREQRKQGRRVLMDNSMHELNGVPLSVGELLEAARVINPNVIIPPDKLGDMQFTYAAFHNMRKHPGCRWDPALVIQGKTYEERIQHFMDGRKYSQTVCFPFREPRLEWFTQLRRGVPHTVAWPTFLHLFGVNDLRELTEWSFVLEQSGWPAAMVCVDTAKPVKWGMQEHRFKENQNLRGGGLLDHKAEMTEAQLAATVYNIAFTRRYTS